MLDSFELGKWDIENENQRGVFIRAKMYALLDKKTNKSQVKGNGVP